jgi:exodeoxyribonuclease III
MGNNIGEGLFFMTEFSRPSPTGIRLVVWNCADGFARKASVLEALQADLAIVPECRRAALAKTEIDERRICWVGPEKGRGLAIISGEEWTLEAVSLDFRDQWFLPVIVRRGSFELRVLGIWVKPYEDYIAPTLRTLEKCKAFLSNNPAIVAGDFNQNTIWDKATSKRRFADVIAKLADLNLVSAWHAFHAETHGQESKPTLYFRRSIKETFHIDYAFLPNEETWKVSRVEIGSYEDWVLTGYSDHVPLIVETLIPVTRNVTLADS